MKKTLSFILAAVLTLGVGMTGCGQKPAESVSGADSAAPAFKLKSNVDFLVSSNAGGGSDIFTRSITDIAGSKGFVDQPFVVNNLADGNGQISRRQVSTARNVDATLLCFSAGDLSAMLNNGGMTMADFTPISILAADKHLAFVHKDGKYKSMEEVIAAAKAGEKINVGGTASDEKVVYEMMTKELGLEGQFNYIVYSSAAETITALLGGHVQVGLAKPAASQQYVISGDILPIVALSSEKFAAPFDVAPTMADLGYATVEYPVWRGVIGSKDMTPEGLAFWSDVFKQISDSEEWKTDYLEKNLLVNQYMDTEATKAIMLEAEQSVLAAMQESK